MSTLTGTRFGTIEFLEDDVIHFADGMIGFPECYDYLLISHKPESKFKWLQSINEPAIAFLVTDPAQFIDGYAPQISDQEAAELKITPDTAMLLLTTASIPAGQPEKLTLNLAGPIVVNLEARQARQFVMDSEKYPTRCITRVDTAENSDKVAA